jgi:hypothetical protein
MLYDYQLPKGTLQKNHKTAREEQNTITVLDPVSYILNDGPEPVTTSCGGISGSPSACAR